MQTLAVGLREDDNAYSPLHIAHVHTPIQGFARTIIAFLVFKGQSIKSIPELGVTEVATSQCHIPDLISSVLTAPYEW